MDENIAKEVLVQYLKANCDEDITIDDLDVESYDHYGLTLVSYGREEYAIGNDEEADNAAEQEIENSLYAFNASWIRDHLNNDFPIEGITALQEKYEDGNEPLKKLIEKFGDWDYFVSDSILADGRGHFISSYDGEENEQRHWYFSKGRYIPGELYVIYRIN